MTIKKVMKDKRGNSTPLTIALILGLLLLICAMAEFFRLGIIVQGVRDGLQQAVITVATTNYDETYNGLREGYSGGYALSGESWQENLDYDDVYNRLDNLLETTEAGGYHIKEDKSGYEYRLSGLSVDIENTPLTPGSANDNLEVDARITIEIPLSFGWGKLPPLKMELRTRSAYMPKF
ncbi:MAG: hypothetical protein WHF31_05770 [Candidatus Dehalobacter alkaniphilus]|jgi:hypothetical protein